MGIQAFFKTKHLRKAGIQITSGENTRWRESEDSAGYEVDFVEKWAKLTFPDGTVHTVHQQDDERLWCDFNYWGNNRPVLEPLFKQYKIPYKEC